MTRLINILELLFLITVVASCYNKITCPAYQSQFLFDESKFKERFSLFEADSTPKKKIGNVKKSKYGIIVQKTYRKKFNDMKTIPMETIYPESPDSLMIAWVVPDSLMTDSLSTRPVYYSPYLTIFNNDQALYDAMYGYLLRSPRSSRQEISEDLKVEESQQPVEEKKNRKFRLFRRKDKNKEEPAEGGKKTEKSDQQ